MTILREVLGLCTTCCESMKRKKITVRMTADAIGKTLSLSDEKKGIMLTIPIEPIEKDLLNTMGWEKK